MKNLAIRAEGISKRYFLGARSFPSPRELLARGLSRVFDREGGNSSPSASEFWALRDISLEIGRGEVVGLIGRNGAGKSTLLKILSRITRPTCGSAEIRGRLGSLLEVGTGFHPELTGRENIFLNGAILGMTRAEIRRKFDEIVAFAEVQQFLNTPVKRYSSGMYVRLAFAIAAHLEPDILIVDEVLSVGDAAFQKKCLGKIKDVAGHGRTVVFVSHDVSVVSNLCETAHWLERGKVVLNGPATEVVKAYLESSYAASGPGSGRVEGAESPSLVREVRFLAGEAPTRTFFWGEPFTVEVRCRVDPTKARVLGLGFGIDDEMGMRICGSNMHQYDLVHENVTGFARYRAHIDQLLLRPGSYSLSLYLGNESYDHEVIERAAQFDIVWKPRPDIPEPQRAECGPVFFPVRWEASFREDEGGTISPLIEAEGVSHH